MGYNKDIEAAIIFLKNLKIINYSKIVRDFKINYIILYK